MESKNELMKNEKILEYLNSGKIKQIKIFNSIGEKRAQKIIDYTKTKKLSKLNDLKKIGINTIQKIKNTPKKKFYKKKKKSGSEIAKGGYKEEECACLELNKNIILKKAVYSFTKIIYDNFEKKKGTSKTDIQTIKKTIKMQVKKYNKIFQQLDRHWLEYLIRHIPKLEPVLEMLKNVFEYQLLSDGKHIDKDKGIKKLSLDNYSQEELNNFLKILNENKKEILEYAFFGTKYEEQPVYLLGIKYDDNNRKEKLIIFKIKDIINYLETLDFEITKGATVIKLGKEKILTLQRKGGDSGKKSSNQLQIKITVHKLENKIKNKLEHIF